jgi:hypothetical protein
MAIPAVGAFFATPGPKELYVKFAASLTANTGAGIGSTSATGWQFLGTCVTAPDISEFPKFIDVYNDYGGRSVPTQLIWDGSESRLACTINRIDLAACRNVRDQPSHVGVPGSEYNIDRGSLVIGLTDFQFAFKDTYFGTANATPGLPPGRVYFSVVLEGYEEHTTGTRVEEVSLLLRCNNIREANGQFQQYSEDPAVFPSGLTPN